jgi:hypothetical protein
MSTETSSNFTIEQSRAQTARLLRDAQANYDAACATLTELKDKLAAAYVTRDDWEAEVRRLTPRAPRGTKKSTEQPGLPTIEDLHAEAAAAGKGGGGDE